MIRRRDTAAAGLALGAVLVLAGCGSDPELADDSDYGHDPVEPVMSGDDFVSELELGDDRRVRLAYTRRGLVEQHFSPDEGSWSSAQVIYRTKSDPCQGIELEESDGRVGVIADFGQYCYDGEPPTESVSATATDSLEEWQVEMTPDIDGWTGMKVGQDEVEWTSPHYPTLRWQDGDGFSRDD